MNWIKNIKNTRPKSRLSRDFVPQYLLLFFMVFTLLPACKTKEGCTADQKKAFTNNMESSKKKGKSNLFSKTMRKRMK